VHDKLLENKDKLFFINFHTNSLHNPFIYPANRIEEKPTEPYKKIADDAFAISFTGPGYPPRKETLGPFPKNETNNVMYKITMYNNQKINVSYDNAYTDRKKYTNQIQYIDEELEKIFSLLEEKKMLDNTIVVLFSNHGLGLWDQGISVMGVSYQSNVHIPILIKHPKIKEQIRIKTPISPVDLGPTIYEMLGIKMNQKVSGHSLIPLITKGKYGREFIFGQDLQMEYVREGNWKLIVKDVGEKELYNLWQDPHEEENVYDLNIDKARKLGVALRKEKTKQIQIAQEMKDEFDISNST
jgi:arylsulfatase A-like enzyme